MGLMGPGGGCDHWDQALRREDVSTGRGRYQGSFEVLSFGDIFLEYTHVSATCTVDT